MAEFHRYGLTLKVNDDSELYVNAVDRTLSVGAAVEVVEWLTGNLPGGADEEPETEDLTGDQITTTVGAKRRPGRPRKAS